MRKLLVLQRAKWVTVVASVFLTQACSSSPESSPPPPSVTHQIQRQVLQPRFLSANAGVVLSADGQRLVALDARRAALVYSKTSEGWTLETEVPTSANAPSQIQFNGDGTLLAVARAATGDGGVSVVSRSVTILQRTAAGSWTEQATLAPALGSPEDKFADESVALSENGQLLVVGASMEDSNATGVDGDRTNDAAPNSGAAYVFARVDAGWTELAYLKASNAEAGDRFGTFISTNRDGTVIAVTAQEEASSSKTDPLDNRSPGSGAVYVFEATGGRWMQVAYLKSSSPTSPLPGQPVHFGASSVMTPTGTKLFVGETDTFAGRYVRVFNRSSAGWSRGIDISSTASSDAYSSQHSSAFGLRLAISEDARFMATSNYLWGDHYGGMGFLLEDLGSGWLQRQSLQNPQIVDRAYLGSSMAMDRSAETIVTSAPGDPQSPIQIFSCSGGLSSCVKAEMVSDSTPVTASNGGGTGTGGGGAGATGGGGGGSGIASDCSTVATHYIGDAQFDTMCAVAVCYSRTGHADRAQAVCTQMHGLVLENGFSVANCPAC